ncbi:NAD(P)H-binding protein [Actinomadura litoris]|uniref:NAD(P)H-binding protein n=1 Tax=Actinomadura litoris TaxID=2678616 RepID=UPI001FA75AD2|nr:NAD(P)H-binding protein [Actinomadura litoris]
MTILVTGARGKIARNLVRLLLDGGHDVRAAGRDPSAARLPPEVEVVAADLADPGTLGPALKGARTVFAYADRGGLDGFARRAADAGVEHIVLLSAAGASATSGDPIARMHGAAERAVAASGVPWTFLRAGGFASNTLQWAGTIRALGAVRDPFPESRSAPVHEADVAAVALAVLTGTGHRGGAPVLTGPETLTRRRQAELIGEALGRRLAFEVQDLAEHRRDLARWGPPEVVEALVRNSAEAVRAPLPPTGAVEEITGRPARTFAGWARDHRGDFA